MSMAGKVQHERAKRACSVTVCVHWVFGVKTTSQIDVLEIIWILGLDDVSYGCKESDFLKLALICRLPDNVSLEEGAILEPLSVGVHACKRAGVTVGSVALVLGAGPIGLVTLLAAKAFGASKVLIADIVENRLKVAKELGADYTLLIGKNDTDELITKKIVDTLGVEPTVSFDCTGVELCVRIAVQVRKMFVWKALD